MKNKVLSLALAGVAWLGVVSCTKRSPVQLLFRAHTQWGVSVKFPLGCIQEATKRCFSLTAMSLSLPLSPSLFLKSTKHIFKVNK